MRGKKLHPLRLSLSQFALRDFAVQQIGELLTTLERLNAITSMQANIEVISDIRSNLNNHVVLFAEWFSTSPVDDRFANEE